MGVIGTVLREFLLKNESREVYEKIKAEKSEYQDRCPHRQGCAVPIPGLRLGSLTCIIWHTFEDDEPGRPKGLCSNCGRLFLPTDPDYAAWRAKPSGHTPSTGGLRQLEPSVSFPIDALYERPLRQTLQEFINGDPKAA